LLPECAPAKLIILNLDHETLTVPVEPLVVIRIHDNPHTNPGKSARQNCTPAPSGMQPFITGKGAFGFAAQRNYH
jgi:hypothetical protein